VITGTNLAGTTEVLFNGLSSSFIVNHSGQITATVPANAVAGKILVFAPGGSVQSTSNFVVRPTIFNFTPNVGRPGTNVTLTGANLNEGTPVVRFGTNIASSVSGVTFGQLTATVPNGAVTSLISVTTTNGSHTNDALFYLPPRITTFSSSNAPVSTAITINGTNFLGASSVLFNGVPAAFFNVSNFSMQAVVPAGFVTGPVSITTPAGTTNSPGLYYAMPTISSFSPVHGLTGTNVIILGTSFSNASAVAFGGVPSTSFTVLSNSGVRATVPTNALSGLISVTAPAGTAFSASPFTLDTDIPVPALSFSVSGSNLQLAWPTNLIPFTLQATTNVASAPAWTNILTTPTKVGNSNVITEPMTGAGKYYRLKK
jgi:large repetitive protein